jgi:hypothetical protein
MQLKGPLRNKTKEMLMQAWSPISIIDARNQFHNNFTIRLQASPLRYKRLAHMMVVQPSSTRKGGCDSQEKSPLDVEQLVPHTSN